MFKRWHSFSPDAKRYLISGFFLAGFFTWPFWYGFALQRITPAEFGVYLAVSYIVGILAEIPTGAFADTYGRKRSSLIGVSLFLCYAPIVYFWGSFEAYLISAVVSGIGSAFSSGSLDSLLYESPDVDKQQFKQVMQTASLFWQSGLIVSTGIGGLLFALHPSLPFFAQSGSFLIALFVITGMTSDYHKKEKKPRNYLQSMRAFVSQNRQGFMHLFDKRQLLPIIALGLFLDVIVLIGIDLLNEALMIRHGLDPAARGLLLAITKIFVVIMLAVIVYRRLKREESRLIYLSVLAAGAGLLYAFDSYVLFFAGFLLFNFVSSTLDAFIRPIIHDHVVDKYRATALSSFKFLSSLGVMASSLILGFLLKETSIAATQRWFYGVMILLLIPALIFSLRSLSTKNW